MFCVSYCSSHINCSTLRSFVFKMLSRVIMTLLALAASSIASVTHKGYDLSTLAMMEGDEKATFYTASGASATAETILGGNSARLR